MANLLVGDKEKCNFNRLVLCITKPPSAIPDLRIKWIKIAAHLDVSAEEKDAIENGIALQRKDILWVIEKILHNFRSSKSTKATLDQVIKAFDDSDLGDIADSIRQEFNIPREISSQTTNDTTILEPTGKDTTDTRSNSPKDGGCLGKSRPPCHPKLWKVEKANLMRVNIVPPVLPMDFDDDYYKLSLHGKRYALILNIVQFKDRPRFGAIYDSYNLTQLFPGLNYQVENHNDFKVEFTKDHIQQIIKKFKEKCIDNKAETFTVFLGSHGEYGNICLPNGESVNLYDDIIYEMGSTPAKYPEWAKIPKVFIISACRDKVQRDSLKPIENAIVCFSCLPNKPSHRDPDGGTEYIKRFVEVMMNEAHQSDFEEILKEVENKLWKETSRQMPNYEKYDFHKLYFNFA